MRKTRRSAAPSLAEDKQPSGDFVHLDAETRDALRAQVRRAITDLRTTRKALREKLRVVGSMRRLPSAKTSILFYFRQFIGQRIETIELELVSGISEYARRIRELRVEDGYDIRTEFSDDGTPFYVLASSAPDVDIAGRWREAHEIRKMSGSGAERIACLSSSCSTSVSR